jgi:hypothetical protein
MRLRSAGLAFDLRLMIATRLGFTAFSQWQMMGFSLQMYMHPVFWSGLLQGFGQGLGAGDGHGLRDHGAGDAQ